MSVFCANDWVVLLELLNKVSRLGLLEMLLMRTNHICGFSFSAGFVLSASGGHQVSFNTTVGGVVLLKAKLPP